jgi:hypothetical protein
VEQGVSKLERTGKPVFPVIIETSRASLGTYTIIHNVEMVADSIMENKPFEVERRTRNTVTGAVTTVSHVSTI